MCYTVVDMLVKRFIDSLRSKINRNLLFIAFTQGSIFAKGSGFPADNNFRTESGFPAMNNFWPESRSPAPYERFS
jgi:hypothetical protein